MKSTYCLIPTVSDSFNMLVCVALSVISILPVVQEHMPQSGLLQSSMISLYIMFLTWSAVNSSQWSQCKPNFNPGNRKLIFGNDIHF